MTDRGRGCRFIDARQGGRTLTNDIAIATYLLSKLPITYPIGQYVYRLVGIARRKHELLLQGFPIDYYRTIFVLGGIVWLLCVSSYQNAELTETGREKRVLSKFLSASLKLKQVSNSWSCIEFYLDLFYFDSLWNIFTIFRLNRNFIREISKDRSLVWGYAFSLVKEGNFMETSLFLGESCPRFESTQLC